MSLSKYEILVTRCNCGGTRTEALCLDYSCIFDMPSLFFLLHRLAIWAKSLRKVTSFCCWIPSTDLYFCQLCYLSFYLNYLRVRCHFYGHISPFVWPLPPQKGCPGHLLRQHWDRGEQIGTRWWRKYSWTRLADVFSTCLLLEAVTWILSRIHITWWTCLFRHMGDNKFLQLPNTIFYGVRSLKNL